MSGEAASAQSARGTRSGCTTKAKVAIRMDDAESPARMADELKKPDYLKDEDLNLNLGPLGDLM